MNYQTNKIRRIELLETIRQLGNAVSDCMMETPGGDKMIFEGSSNIVNAFRDAEASYIRFLEHAGITDDA